MANVRLSRLFLYDRFPGPVNPNKGVPVDGWSKTCVTEAEYPEGEKRMAYTDNSHCPGYYTMMYGTLAGISASNFCVSADFSDGKCFVGHCCLTEDVSHAADPTYLMANPDGTYQPMYVMHRCTTDAVTDLTNAGGAAIPCATMDPYDYGWFWVGGVCPCKEVTSMDESDLGIGVDLTTSGSVIPGGFYLAVTALTALPEADFSAVCEISVGGAANAKIFATPPVDWSGAPDA
jgi:hypothetical protein